MHAKTPVARFGELLFRAARYSATTLRISCPSCSGEVCAETVPDKNPATIKDPMNGRMECMLSQSELGVQSQILDPLPRCKSGIGFRNGSLSRLCKTETGAAGRIASSARRERRA